jgi:YbgC/YbaW family acyl-CoA thioester hydrolase
VVIVNRGVYSRYYVRVTKLSIMEKLPQSFYTIRFSDCDPFGHLNNARYIDYFLNAREDHLLHHYQLRLDDFAKKGIGWVVSRHEILYSRPAWYNEKISIRSALIELSEAQLLVEMLMQDESRQYNKAIMWSAFTCVNIKSGKKENHPESFMEFAKQIVEPSIDIKSGIRGRLDLLTATAKM